MYQYVVESYYYASLDMKEMRGVDETLRKEKKKVYKGNEREKKLWIVAIEGDVLLATN